MLLTSLTLSAGLRYEPYSAPSDPGRVGQLAFPGNTPVRTGDTLYKSPSALNFAPLWILAAHAHFAFGWTPRLFAAFPAQRGVHTEALARSAS